MAAVMAAAAGREPVTRARRLVVKLGTSVLTGGPTTRGAGLDLPYFARLASQVQALAAGGRETVIVSSAAIACGMHVLGLKERPRAIPMKQACAAVGQSGLMRAYEEAFAPHGRRSPNADLNERIAAGILACFPPELFDSTGLFHSLWMVRLRYATEEAEGMLEELIRTERACAE
ncbi:MAG TPA: hypothetical protein VIM86_04745, partial [Thermodesulfobacteriota bacterium]